MLAAKDLMLALPVFILTPVWDGGVSTLTPLRVALLQFWKVRSSATILEEVW